MALVIPPTIFAVHIQFNLLYQFWIHTEVNIGIHTTKRLRSVLLRADVRGQWLLGGSEVGAGPWGGPCGGLWWGWILFESQCYDDGTSTERPWWGHRDITWFSPHCSQSRTSQKKTGLFLSKAEQWQNIRAYLMWKKSKTKHRFLTCSSD